MRLEWLYRSPSYGLGKDVQPLVCQDRVSSCSSYEIGGEMLYCYRSSPASEEVYHFQTNELSAKFVALPSNWSTVFSVLPI